MLFGRTILFLSGWAALASLPANAVAQAATNARPDPALRITLEGSYDGWRQAMATGDLAKWEEVTAFSRQIETRNRIVSQKLPFPQALFEDPLEAPALGGLIALGVLSTGETATSTYFGKANFGGDPGSLSDNLIVLHFLREEGKWRFDTLRVVKMGSDSNVLLQIRNSDFSFLRGAEFQPAAQLPPVDQPVQTPELIAEAWIDATGYEVTLFVNGHRTGTFSDVKITELVMGGLKKGGNSVLIRTRRLDKATGDPAVEIAIYGAAEPGKPAKRYYHYNPGSEVKAEVKEGFTVAD